MGICEAFASADYAKTEGIAVCDCFRRKRCCRSQQRSTDFLTAVSRQGSSHTEPRLRGRGSQVRQLVWTALQLLRPSELAAYV